MSSSMTDRMTGLPPSSTMYPCPWENQCGPALYSSSVLRDWGCKCSVHCWVKRPKRPFARAEILNTDHWNQSTSWGVKWFGTWRNVLAAISIRMFNSKWKAASFVIRVDVLGNLSALSSASTLDMHQTWHSGEWLMDANGASRALGKAFRTLAHVMYECGESTG